MACDWAGQQRAKFDYVARNWTTTTTCSMLCTARLASRPLRRFWRPHLGGPIGQLILMRLWLPPMTTKLIISHQDHSTSSWLFSFSVSSPASASSLEQQRRQHFNGIRQEAQLWRPPLLTCCGGCCLNEFVVSSGPSLVCRLPIGTATPLGVSIHLLGPNFIHSSQFGPSDRKKAGEFPTRCMNELMRYNYLLFR